MPFKKGVSGNPSGRPKVVAHLRDLAREHTEEAVKALVEEMRDKKGAARVTAAMALLDRGYGKPTQYVENNANPFDTLNEEDLAALDAAFTAVKGIGAQGDTTSLN